MRNLPNLEKSAFHKGCYVGYGNGTVYRIQPSNSSYGNWCAYPADMSLPLVFGFRLRDISRKLAEPQA